LSPEFILSNWTKEEFDLMLEKMNERYERQNEAVNNPDSRQSGDRRVSDKEAFAALGIIPKRKTD
jgi:hypothetical protein